MSMTLEELKAEALKLSNEERESLAEFLYASVDGEESALDEEWQAEIARRIEEVQSGAVRMIAADQVFAAIGAERAGMHVSQLGLG